MAIIDKLLSFYRKKHHLKLALSGFKIKNFNIFHIIIFSAVFLFSVIFISTQEFLERKNLENKNNLQVVTKSNEFFNLSNYFISKINSPYEKVKYQIKINDSIEKILKEFGILNIDIKNISFKLKQKKLSNIYSGRELTLIYKKLENGTNTLINLIYQLATQIQLRLENLSKISQSEKILLN